MKKTPPLSTALFFWVLTLMLHPEFLYADESLTNGLRTSLLDNTYVVGELGGSASGSFPFSTTTDSNGVPYWIHNSWTNNNDIYFIPQAVSMTLNGTHNHDFKFWMFYSRGSGVDNRFRSSVGFSSTGVVGGNFTVAGNTIDRVSWSNAFGSNTAASQYFVSVARCEAPICRVYLAIWTNEDLSYIDTQQELYDYMGAVAGLDLISSDIATTTVWHSGHTYKVSGNVSVHPGVTLTVEPGTVVKFDTSTSSSLIINGMMSAIGTAASTTYFTSWKDDVIGGDTNVDATSTSPMPGDWGGIQVGPNGVINLGHAFVRYGGSVGSSSAMIHNNGGILNIATSTVAHGSNYGIRNSSGTTTVTATDISFNDYGFYLSGGNATISATSTIHENATYGVFNNTTATSSIIAENNFWATSTGPFNATYNPTGTGDAVSDYVDFSPWIGQLHFVRQETVPSCLPNNCDSVVADQILVHSTSTYTTELASAITTWNAVGDVDFVVESDPEDANLSVFDVDLSDVAFLGFWNHNDTEQDILALNSYYLDLPQFVDLRENTILHELGHALGLDHSYWGNVMYSFQDTQSSLGLQDVADYLHLWQN